MQMGRHQRIDTGYGNFHGDASYSGLLNFFM